MSLLKILPENARILDGGILLDGVDIAPLK